MGQPTVATTQLIRNISMFDVMDSVTWKRTLLATANLAHNNISGILDDQLHPEPLYWTRCGRGGSATRGGITSSSVLVDNLENEGLTPGSALGAGGEDDKAGG